MNNIDLIIKELSDQLEFKKPVKYTESAVEQLSLMTEDTIDNFITQKLEKLSYDIEENNGFKVIDDILLLTIPEINSKDELSKIFISDIKNGLNQTPNFKKALINKWKLEINLNINSKLEEHQAAEELIKYLLLPTQTINLDLCQYVYAKAIEKHLELRGNELITDSIEDLSDAFSPFDLINGISWDASEDLEKQANFILDVFWNHSEWKDSFKSEFDNHFVYNLRKTSKIISTHHILIPLLKKALREKMLPQAMQALDSDYSKNELQYNQDIQIVQQFNSFEKYIAAEVSNFKNNNLAYLTILNNLERMNPDQIKSTISDFVYHNLKQAITEKLLIFLKERKKIKIQNITTHIDSDELYELGDHLYLVGYNYAINKLISLRQEALNLSNPSALNEFKDHFHFVSMQEHYILKICNLLGVDRSIIQLNSELKSEKIETLGSSFSIAYVSSKLNGIYPMSFRRLSQYVQNKTNMTHESLIKFLLHETTHIKQMEDKRLYYKTDATGKKLFWEGQDYTPSKTLSYEEYLSLPWEIEARESESRYIEIIDRTETNDELINTLKKKYKLIL